MKSSTRFNLGRLSFALAVLAIVLFYGIGLLYPAPADQVLAQQYMVEHIGITASVGLIRFVLAGLAILLGLIALFRKQSRVLAGVAIVAMGLLHFGYYAKLGYQYNAPIEWRNWQAVKTAVANSRLWSGTMAPQFSFEATDGRQLTSDNLKGKFVVVNVWATWCPPCHAELPQLKTFVDAHQNDVVVLGVSPEEAEVVSKYAEREQVNYPLVALSYADYKGMPAPFNQVAFLPHSFIIDRNGVLKKLHAGTITAAELEQLVSGDYTGAIKPEPGET